MKIPKRLKLMGHSISVSVVSKKAWYEFAPTVDLDPDEACAVWLPSSDRIVMMRNKNKELLFHTFWHESMHAILDMMSHKLSRDEVFVDQSAALIAQAIATAEYK